MKIDLSLVIGICIGALISWILNPDSVAIQLFNTVSILLIAIYLKQNKSETKDINE